MNSNHCLKHIRKFKVQEKNIDLDSIWDETFTDYRDYSILDLNFDQLKDVTNSDKKFNLLNTSALDCVIDNSDNNIVHFQNQKKSDIKFDISEKYNKINNIFENLYNKSFKKKSSKTKEQIDILKFEFEKNPYWDKEKISQLSKITKLSEKAIYKWKWDNSFMI